MFLSALALTALPALPAPPQAAPGEELRVAMTASGLRVEAPAARPGDLSVVTPFGRFATPTDPVVGVLDLASLRDRLLAWHEAGDLDTLSLARDLSRAGLLTELAGLVDALVEGRLTADEETVLATVRLWEDWGRRLDPLPADLPLERRTAELWDLATQRGEPARALAAAARLREEVPQGHVPDRERVVPLGELRRTLERGEPWARRAAAFVAGARREYLLRGPALEASLTAAEDLVRDAAAWAAWRIDRDAALFSWSQTLARGPRPYRAAAAAALGRQAGRPGTDMLIHVLAAFEKPVNRTFEFQGRKIKVVAEPLSRLRSFEEPGITPASGSDCNATVSFLGRTIVDRPFLELGSHLLVTTYGGELRDAILEALDEAAGEETGRDAQTWIAWYRGRPADEASTTAQPAATSP